MGPISFEITYRIGDARRGVINTKHGDIQTPAFVPVATTATIKGITMKQLEEIGADCTLSNTYHLFLRPGNEIIKKQKGLHGFMHWDKPIFTDSGGFQAFSLGAGMENERSKFGKEKSVVDGKSDSKHHENFAKVTDEGVYFKSVYDGSKHFMGAKESMQIQADLGADIIMAFDECTSPHHDYAYHKIALERTKDWALQSLEFHDKKQALYGIIQGGKYEDLRKESAVFTNNQAFDGIAIGGSFGDAYGDSKKNMHDVLDWVIPLLDDRPRHMLGIGGIDDIFECVSRGIDTFDCVHPTRIARRGNLFIRPESGGSMDNKFRVPIKTASFKHSSDPIDKNCDCFTCKHYSKSYLRHLFVNKEITYYQLAIIHNLRFMFRLMQDIRESLENGTFEELKSQWLQ
ncbi:MAG: tRNA guanosine(34) transglycosylase Tgt [Candidatus Woesearchaeota archaeon]